MIPYQWMRYWAKALSILLGFWLRLLGPKALIGLFGASTLLAVFLNYRF